MEEEELHVKEVSFSFRPHYSLSSPAVLEKKISKERKTRWGITLIPLCYKRDTTVTRTSRREREKEKKAQCFRNVVIGLLILRQRDLLLHA